MANNLGKFLVPAKAVASKPFSLPKVAQGHPMSGSQASRSAGSGYGKVFRIGGGEAGIPMQKTTEFTASHD
jgi:hypothetical protein